MSVAWLDGEPIALPFRFITSVGQQDEQTVGVVPAAAVVEWLVVVGSAQPYVVKLYAVVSRVPDRLNVGTAIAPQGQLLTWVQANSSGVQEREGFEVRDTATQERWMGVVVPWGPWYLVARHRNLGAALGITNGLVRVRLVEDAVAWPRPAWGKKMDARYLARVGR